MTKFNWRDHLAVHPAADLFPLMSESALQELADDIKQSGVRTPIYLWIDTDDKEWLLDGRNRLDALAMLGLLKVDDDGCVRPATPHGFIIWLVHAGHGSGASGCHTSGDPYAVALSLNVHRRHLTAEQKRELIAKLLKAAPESSNRTIAKTVTADHKTVAAVRSEMEGRGEIPHVETHTDSAGRKQPAKRELPAKVKVNGQPTRTADFSPAAQAQIAKALDTATLQPSDNAAAFDRENNDGSGCNYDPTDTLPGDTYSSVWERQVDVACQTVEFVITNLDLDLANNLQPNGYRIKRKQLEAIQLAVNIWSQLKDHCSLLADAEVEAAA